MLWFLGPIWSSFIDRFISLRALAACGLINLDIEMVVVLVGVERSYFLIGPIPKIRIPLWQVHAVLELTIQIEKFYSLLSFVVLDSTRLCLSYDHTAKRWEKKGDKICPVCNWYGTSTTECLSEKHQTFFINTNFFFALTLFSSSILVLIYAHSCRYLGSYHCL